MRTKYPISAGSKVFYKNSEGLVKARYARKMMMLPNGAVRFLVTRWKTTPPEEGVWVSEEDVV
jgi:hypothetical protein